MRIWTERNPLRVYWDRIHPYWGSWSWIRDGKKQVLDLTPPFTSGSSSVSFTGKREECYKTYAAAAAAKSLQSCLTLCDPIDGSPPGSPVPGILQARTLEWVVISFSNAWKWKVKVKSLSCVWLFATPWTVAHQAPPSMGFSRQEYWSGLPLPSPYKTYGRLLIIQFCF